MYMYILNSYVIFL